MITWIGKCLTQSKDKKLAKLQEQLTSSEKEFTYMTKYLKLDVERYLYVIDAIENGKPSGRYRTYSRMN